MSRRRREPDPEPGLFDLPLDDPNAPAGESGSPRPTPAAPAGPREAPGEPPGPPTSPAPSPEEPGVRELEVRELHATAAPPPVSLAARLLAGFADLAVHLAVAVALLFGTRLLGVPAGVGDSPALLLFLLIFSFLYTVVPLAFWGQTPGMAWAGLVARTPEGDTLTFGQTARRWLGGVLSVVLLGLPVLLALGGGRSLSDRLSGSVTRPA